MPRLRLNRQSCPPQVAHETVTPPLNKPQVAHETVTPPKGAGGGGGGAASVPPEKKSSNMMIGAVLVGAVAASYYVTIHKMKDQVRSKAAKKLRGRARATAEDGPSFCQLDVCVRTCVCARLRTACCADI